MIPNTYHKTETLAEYFKLVHELLSLGLVQITSQTHPVNTRGANFIKQDDKFFSTCSEHEYNKFNDTDDENN